jgi:hypothetical protein
MSGGLSFFAELVRDIGARSWTTSLPAELNASHSNRRRIPRFGQ